MEVEKKQEFKDFSFDCEVLINELSDAEVSKLFPPLKPVCQKEDNFEIINKCERFVDAAIGQSQRGLTENRAETYLTTDDPRIDFFFKVLEDTREDETIRLLEQCWKHNSLDALRLIAYLRDIRNGKAIRYQYYVCLYWLYVHHPRTLLKNLKILIDCGYWKDPLQLVMIILFKGKVFEYLFQEEFNSNHKTKVLIKSKKMLVKNAKMIDSEKKLASADVKKIKYQFYKRVNSDFNEKIVEYYKAEIDDKYKPLLTKGHSPCCDEKVVRERKSYEIDRKHMKEMIIRYARERFNGDAKYRYFHLKCAELIAKQLIEDMDNLKCNNLKKITLAAKWAPSLNGHFDKYTLIGSSIALQIVKLTKDRDSSLDTIFSKPTAIATYLARKHYHKNYIVKLREYLKIPESYMCKNEWNSLPYEMVPSKCMQKNRRLFIEHDHDRFEEFVKSKSQISGATLKPPELVKRAMEMKSEDDLEKELLEKQWLSLRNSIKVDDKDSCFKSALSVCDVSGSMDGIPMQAAIGLTLMTMSFTSEPWCNICVTFSADPKFIHFQKDQTFCQQVNQICRSDAGLNTDLSKTFKLILDLALKLKLKQNEMPKYLFIFTDMEFDQVCDPDETNLEEAKRLFADAGYNLPTIICWNLRDSQSIPVQKNEQGTILLSGYSAKQLSLLLNINIDDITPFLFLEDFLSIAAKKYENLVVID